MARGRKMITPEERLEELDNKIKEFTESLKYLKEEKAKLEQEIQNKQLAELYDIIKASGKSIEEVKEMIA